MSTELLTAPTETAPFEVPPIQEPEQREGFKITDKQSANWVVAKIVDCDKQKASNKAWIAEENERQDDRKAGLLARFQPELESFVADDLGQKLVDGKVKSIKLPAAQIGYQMQAESKLEVTDKAEAEAWAERHLPGAMSKPLLIDVSALSEDVWNELAHFLAREHVDFTLPKSALKPSELLKHFTETGEVPDGCKHIAPGDKFYVRPVKAQD